VAQRNGKGHHDQAGKRCVDIHERFIRAVLGGAIVNRSEGNEKFAFVM
jgi:hypothetical protein